MNRKYIFLAFLLIALGAGLLILPTRSVMKQIDPEKLMIEIMQPTRYVTTDQVAGMIIENDPTIRLVDVRPMNEYAAFSLPGSVSIPLDSIVTPTFIDILKENGMKVIFYDNDDIISDQAWVIARRLGYKNIYVMEGGLNEWVSTIIQPILPPETAPSQEFDLYNQRKGASLYFTGAKIESNDIKAEVKVSRKKKSGAEGGC